MGSSKTLTEAQKTRLNQLEQEILHDRITTSFTIDDRNEVGRRMATFFSTTVTKRQIETDFGPSTPSPGWTSQEVAVVGCVVARQVVLTTYKDAVRRRVITKAAAKEELPGILASYDRELALLLGSEDAEEEPSAPDSSGGANDS